MIQDFPELMKPIPNENEIQLKVVPFTLELLPSIEHLARTSHTSGMNTWFRTLKTGTREWIGLPPTECVIAFKMIEGKQTPIGWCGIGRFNSKLSVIGTFVREDFRKGGIAGMLAKATVQSYLQKNELKCLAYDRSSWDCSHILKSAGATMLVDTWDVSWYDKKEYNL